MRYFVDTNVIISYVNRESQEFVDFIETPQHTFYYTNTVRSEYVNGDVGPIPPIFKYIDTHIPFSKKDAFYTAFVKKNNLTTTQAQQFKNDIYIAIEFCYSRVDVMKDIDEPLPHLITNNMKFLRRFIQQKADIFEQYINLYGFEHLGDITTPPVSSPVPSSIHIQIPYRV